MKNIVLKIPFIIISFIFFIQTFFCTLISIGYIQAYPSHDSGFVLIPFSTIGYKISYITILLFIFLHLLILIKQINNNLLYYLLVIITILQPYILPSLLTWIL